MDDAVIALILRAAMPMHRSPLGRLVSLIRYVIDLEAGRVDLQDYDTRTVGRLERHVVLLQLEYAQTDLTETYIRFDADYFDVPTALIYAGAVPASSFEYVGSNTRGETASWSLENHWQYGRLDLGAIELPGLHLEDRAGAGEEPVWVEFAGHTPYASRRGRPLPVMGVGLAGMRDHAYHWWIVEVCS